jgi:hypothetical protein
MAAPGCGVGEQVECEAGDWLVQTRTQTQEGDEQLLHDKLWREETSRWHMKPLFHCSLFSKLSLRDLPAEPSSL